MSLFVKKSSGWVAASKFFVKKPGGTNGTWVSVTKAFVKKASGWVLFWQPTYTISQHVDISMSINPTTEKYNLTGTNYLWTPDTANPPDSDALTYKFTWYNGNTTSTLAGPTKIPNGLSSGTDYSPSEVNPIPLSNFSANTSNVYTFAVQAPDGTVSQESITLQGPLNISLSITNITSSSATISWGYSSGALSYSVRYKQHSSGSWSSAGSTTNNSITITGLSNIMSGTAYDFEVTPYTGLSGNGYPGNPATATTYGMYFVTFNGNGGLADGISSTVTRSPSYVGGPVSVPTPTKTSATFNGWYDSSSGGTKIVASGVSSYTPSSTITLYAQWTDKYSVTYFPGDHSAGGGSTVDPNSPYDSGSTVTVLTNGFTAAPHYSFSLWRDQDLITRSPGDTFVITKDITFTALWNQDQVYAITYDLNGGSGGTGVPTYDGGYYYNDYATVQFPTTNPSKGGANFIGWSTSSSATTATYVKYGNDQIQMQNNVTLYAVYVTSITNVALTEIVNNPTYGGLTQSGNTATVTWTNATGATSFTVDMTGATVASYGSSTLPLDTSYSFIVTNSGSETATISNQVPGQVQFSWNQSGIQSYRLVFAVSGLGNQTINANSSSSSVVYGPITTGGRTITFTSLTGYTGLNQTGSPVVAFAPSPSYLTIANSVTRTVVGYGTLGVVTTTTAATTTTAIGTTTTAVPTTTTPAPTTWYASGCCGSTVVYGQGATSGKAIDDLLSFCPSATNISTSSTGYPAKVCSVATTTTAAPATTTTAAPATTTTAAATTTTAAATTTTAAATTTTASSSSKKCTSANVTNGICGKGCANSCSGGTGTTCTPYVSCP